MANYKMRGETFEFAQPTNEEEFNRLFWLASKSSNPEYRRLAKRYMDMGIAAKVEESSSSTLEQPCTVHFSEISLIARQVLNRRGIAISGTSVTFPAGTTVSYQKTQDIEVFSYVLPDEKVVESIDGSLNFHKN